MPDECESRFDIGHGELLRCAQHLGPPGRWRHSARHLGFRWYWTTAQEHREGASTTTRRNDG